MCSPRCGNLWLEPRSGQTKDYKNWYFLFLGWSRSKGKGQKAGWFAIKTKCSSVATYQPADCCCSEPALCKFNNAYSLVQIGQHLIEMKFILAKNKLTNVSLGVQQQPYTHSSRDFASYFEKCKILRNNTHVGGKIIAIHVHHIRSNKLSISAH